MQVRDWLPYLAIVGALATGLQINRNYVENIREEAVNETAEKLALANLSGDVKSLTDTVKQSIENLKSQTWTDNQDVRSRVTANEASLNSIREQLHAHEKQRLQDEINRLREGR